MNPKTSLRVIFIISISGLLFSGYLSYGELFAGSCSASFMHCGSWSFADLPACVYGFVMYLIVFIISLLGILGKKQKQASEPISQQ